ncbi:thermonuclease [Halanaerobium saccharolyticum subsp. saccharolyticum DSM 6643]|uniref:Thermonuclease n=1 Tax=Halanaerobium saccharolyticum subsp. saccharolyticum DSM 6643 TaxID=1293054 RepID=M5E3D2_9FIRM|nr:thermonuclease family protein [Halanaerobium saccharolyticum]CCU80711.1 thermonuclease [Halanaerobium saccharolyticum subsp. saccharolyticum DSM 6643]
MFKKSLILLTILAVLILSITGCNQQLTDEVYIERVIDGDTVKTAAGDSIRLLGVDTPEIDWKNNNSEYYAEEARDYSIKNLLGENVVLEYDNEKEDHYGRTLAYIFQDGENFNQKLLENGYANLMIVAPNDQYEAEFKKAVKKARKSRLGIWSQILELQKSLPIISYQEAASFIGERVIIEGEIVNTAATTSVNYLNFSNDYQNTLSIIIFNQNLNKFDYPPAEYILDKKIKVLGEIKIYQGSPQIVVNDPHNILIID